jgi:hypothetical protein
VELEDRLEVWWVAGEARLRCNVLTCVVTLGRAVPEEKSVLEGCGSVQFMLLLALWIVLSYE